MQLGGNTELGAKIDSRLRVGSLKIERTTDVTIDLVGVLRGPLGLAEANAGSGRP